MAMRASVTVSMAEETSGTASAMLRDSREPVRTSFGMTSEAAGSSRTSSNVRPREAKRDGIPASR
jgi:hypothetical protein